MVKKCKNWKLALGAGMNSTSLRGVAKEDLKAVVLGTLEDYFRLTHESEQFDRHAALAGVTNCSDDELLDVLAKMGRSPDDSLDEDASAKWERFMDGESD